MYAFGNGLICKMCFARRQAEAQAQKSQVQRSHHSPVNPMASPPMDWYCAKRLSKGGRNVATPLWSMPRSHHSPVNPMASPPMDWYCAKRLSKGGRNVATPLWSMPRSHHSPVNPMASPPMHLGRRAQNCELCHERRQEIPQNSHVPPMVPMGTSVSAQRQMQALPVQLLKQQMDMPASAIGAYPSQSKELKLSGSSVYEPQMVSHNQVNAGLRCRSTSANFSQRKELQTSGSTVYANQPQMVSQNNAHAGLRCMSTSANFSQSKELQTSGSTVYANQPQMVSQNNAHAGLLCRSTSAKFSQSKELQTSGSTVYANQPQTVPQNKAHAGQRCRSTSANFSQSKELQTSGSTVYANQPQMVSQNKAHAASHPIPPQKACNLKEVSGKTSARQAVSVPVLPYTMSMLVNASKEEQRNIMKELLMLFISPLCPAGATEVTCMLLDLETADLLLMLEYPEILRAKVEECKAQLESFLT